MGSPIAGIAVVGHATDGDAIVMSTRGHCSRFINLRAALRFCDEQGMPVMGREELELALRRQEKAEGGP